ncbi:hypothetical protein EMIHUDRAFT_206823 [Emiliania huxleyi CCMP1516]|uniref:Uncharacterized protein n=2 Tax=Emiliania huxleyi TaxID=2903 RepID=A0A0D3JMI6_EMIH1|nr:hypothetical protein EMIHUDRAFT_206823 [Emiliania huxleyi CCMP1516]EOD24721.1 hypothetical protein EMIHUDRAFT_206823 [Emiliania huxleyi CCMP1516]|eukprot:XP_005777150.1 hypothetical protein EMIHUDRAFT_206823 [Emiliania huxleyi CCMP1516]
MEAMDGDTFFARHHADATDTEVLIFALFIRVVDGKWHKETCEAVVKAVDGWEGCGAREGVTVGHLLSYHSLLNKNPDSGGLGGLPQPPRGKRPPKRFKAWAATRVADLIYRRDPILRAALGIPPAAAALPSAPSMIEENAALTATIGLKDQKIEALERELAVCRAQRAGFADKLHKVKKRAERKRADARKYKEAQQRGYSEAQKTARAAQLAMRKRNFDAAVERASYVRVVTLTKKLERANEKLADAGLAHAASLEVKKTEVATARKRARAVEGDAAKLPGLQLQVKELKARVEELRVEEESKSEDDEPSPRPGCSPIVGLLPRRDEHGRWQAESAELRGLRHAQLARGVASSTVSANIQDVLDVLCPGHGVPAACARQSKLMRGEVTIAGEAMAAFKFAASRRVISFGWDESTKFGNSVFSCDFQLEHFDGTIEDVCLRGLSILPHGGTSDTVLMTDTCNGARCTRRMVAAAAMVAVEAKVGKAAWEAMTEEERERKYKTYLGDCWQHRRNIIIEAMAAAANASVKATLDDELDEFSSFERIDPDGSCVIRAAFKQFHHGGEYAKGRGREFESWRKTRALMFLPFERAAGSRRDLAFDGCVPLFINRVTCVDFLRGYIDYPKSQNVLDKSLYTVMKCNEFTALLRVNTLWRFAFSDPLRWLCGSASKLDDWSLYKMGWVLEQVEAGMEQVVADPARLLDPEFDMFAAVAEELPAFRDWRAELLALPLKGCGDHTFADVLREARVPTPGSGNQQLALADKLESQDGVNAWSKNEDAHRRTIDAHATNDAVENKFAIADYIMRFYRNMSVFNVSGVVQQRAAHDYDRPLDVVSDRRKRKAEPAEAPPLGFFWRLRADLRSSLVTMARRRLPDALKEGRAEVLSHDQEKLLRREEAVQRQLNAAVERYAAALELFDQWRKQGVKTAAELERALGGKSEPEQLAELRRQIEMRTVGGASSAAGPLDQDPGHRLEQQSIFNVSNLLEKAKAARELREAAGISDSVEVRQDREAPPFDTRLVGKWLEVCWPYKEDGRTVKIWAAGRVKRVADGLTDKRSPRARKILLAGMLLWAWDTDPEYDEPAGERWIAFLPEKWNKPVSYGATFKNSAAGGALFSGGGGGYGFGPLREVASGARAV